MTTLKYWARLLRIFYNYKKKSAKLPYLPVRLWVELTSYCNYKCIMCPNKDLKEEDKGFMEFDLYKKIIDESHNIVFDINLAHRGESLLHPQIIEMIDYAKQKNLFTRLHTNGSLLTEEMSQKIIASRLDHLSFSFDGYNKEQYEKIRIGGDFNKTVNNIVRFLEIKRKSHAKKPTTAIEVISFSPSKKEKLAYEKKIFLSRFKDLTLDSFVIKNLHNWGGELKKSHPQKKYSVCTFPWNALTIFWDGSVLPCTQDFFGHYLLGNVKDSSLMEIWNGEPMIELRRKLAKREISDLEICSKCDRLWRKGILGVPKDYLWKFLTKRMP
ncbi:MAG: SPASM domain-containing protein [Candidatus Aminicenantes bacterium]|nr:SPASM domain-containing protein [Candidatus Aminicenantes bacterium]